MKYRNEITAGTIITMTVIWAYSRPLHNFRTESSIFFIRLIKSYMCLWGVSRQNALSFQKYALRNPSVPPMSRIDFGSKIVTSHGSIILKKLFKLLSEKQWRYINIVQRKR